MTPKIRTDGVHEEKGQPDIVQQLERLKSESLRSLEVKPEVMRDDNERLQTDLRSVKVWQGACHGYYRMPNGRIVTQWPRTMAAYTNIINKAAVDAYQES